MSNIRFKLIAAESPEKLQEQVDEFLARDDVEFKDGDYQTDGYEKPYSCGIWYHDKDGPASPTRFLRSKVLGNRLG